MPNGPQIDGDTVINAPEAFDVDGAVAGHHNGHFVAGLPQCGGEGSHYVGQTAGLGERRRFGRYHQYSGHTGIVPAALLWCRLASRTKCTPVGSIATLRIPFPTGRSATELGNHSPCHGRKPAAAINS